MSVPQRGSTAAGKAVAAYLRAAASGCRLVFIDDPDQLVELPETVPTHGDREPLRVLAAEGNLQFRLAWQAAPGSTPRCLVLRRRPDVFLPDVQHLARASGMAMALTPRLLLQLATGDEHWPDWVNQEPDLVRARFGGLVKLHRERQPARQDESQRDALYGDLLVRAACGVDVVETGDAAVVWHAVYEQIGTLQAMARRGSRLASRLQAALRGRQPPLQWIDLREPDLAARLVWLVAILQPHLPDVGRLLPELYPAARPLLGADPSALARIAYCLEWLAPGVAASQLALAEAVLDGPLREATVRRLDLCQSDAALGVLARERRSGHLALLAARTLIEGIAIGETRPTGELLPILAELQQRQGGLSQPEAVAEHVELLRCFLTAQDAAAALRHASESDDLREMITGYVEQTGHRLAADLDRADRLLTSHHLADVRWSPHGDASRHKAALATLFGQLAEARSAQAKLRTRSAELAVASPVRGPLVSHAWDRQIEPHRMASGQPRTTLLLVGGLGWDNWEQVLAPPLDSHFAVRASVLRADLPASSRLALSRAVAGERWQPEAVELSLDDLVRRHRAGLGLRRSTRPAKATEPLHASGVLAGRWTSPRLQLIAVDLLAEAPDGLPPALFAERLAALRETVLQLASGGRRDQLVVILGVSGVASCPAAPGLALAGRSWGARCVMPPAAAGPPPAGVAVVDSADWGLDSPSGQLWLAGDTARLVPATPEATVADGGVALSELAVPLAFCRPLPRGETARVEIGPLLAPARALTGQVVELAVYATLQAGALAELVELRVGDSSLTAVLDQGERRRLALPWQAPASPGEVAVEVAGRIGRRQFARQARIRIVAPPDQE